VLEQNSHYVDVATQRGLMQRRHPAASHNQTLTHYRPTHFASRNASFLRYLSVCLYLTYLSFTKYGMGRLLMALLNGEVILKSKKSKVKVTGNEKAEIVFCE